MAKHEVEITDENEDWIQHVRKKRKDKKKDNEKTSASDPLAERVAARFLNR
jgi:hypothetical protein